MADTSLIVNVQLLAEGAAVATDNPNICAIITAGTTVLSSNERYRLYRQGSDVTTDFGSLSAENDFAKAFFGTSPNPISAGGILVMGYWRASDETVPASAATLKGEQLSEAATMPSLQVIDDGSFDIDIDGTTENVTGLDFTTSADFNDVLTELNDGITGATVTLVDQSFIITSDTTGVLSLLTYAIAGASGTDVSTILGLASTGSSVLTQGADSEILPAETKEEAINILKAQAGIKGAVFIDDPTDAEVDALGSWSQANSVLQYDVFSAASNLEIDPTNPVWINKLAGRKKYRTNFSAAGNRKYAVSMMARQHVVNFNGENTANTLNLKELAIPAEDYTDTELNKAYQVGLDVYTIFEKQVSKNVCSPANDFSDNEYNLMAFIDAVRKAYFNVLGTTSTKIAQTTPGGLQLVTAEEEVAIQFRRAGVFAPGAWSSPDFFGDFDTFNRNIEAEGFYILIGEFADQPQADRQDRIAPVMQIAVKNAGAIHRGSTIINFNK